MTTCACCGFPIQDGRQFCPVCDGSAEPDVILEDGTHLYLKPTNPNGNHNLQMELYRMLMDYRRNVEEENERTTWKTCYMHTMW